MNMKYLLRFDDMRAPEVELSGGKGANLAFMTQHGLPIPGGAIISADAYRDFIRDQSWLISSVEQMTADQPARLHEECKAIRARLEQAPIPDGLATEVEVWLDQAGSDFSYSVRSSATLEDSSTAAFAGQHETFLNCHGVDALIQKIKACWLSIWTDRATHYRCQLHLRHIDAAMAVVVQRMVLCDVSGVGFTINPVSGNLNELVLNANYGLGESVVSGEAAVDHWVIDKHNGNTISETISEKTTKTIPAENGIREEPVSREEADAACLDDSQLRTIVSLMVKIEKTYQFPQDIEWGFLDRTPYILQSRPVTTIPERWTRDESAERFPTVITPLTWDLVQEGFHRSLNYSFHLMGFPPYKGKWFELFGHYVYGNQNAVEIYGNRNPIEINSIEDLEEALPVIRKQYHWVQELPVTWLRDLDRYLLSVGELMAEQLENKSLSGIWEYVLRINKLGSDYFLPNIAISLTQSALYRVLLGFLTLVFGNRDAPARFDRLLAFCDTKTGAINTELYLLGCEVTKNSKLKILLSTTSSRNVIKQDRLAGFPEFKSRFETFLRNHGHREMEFDAYHPTWLEAPWVVLDNILIATNVPQKSDLYDRQRSLKLTMQATEYECLQQLPKQLHFFFHELVRLARTYTSLDDLEHYETTRLTLPLRRGLIALGNMLVEMGILDQPMDIFFAHYEILNDAIYQNNTETWRALSEEIRLEKVQYLADKERTPEWVLGETEVQTFAGETLNGLPGSPGKAEGKVYHILGPDDFASFPKGAILVARTTNPTWTPLFYNAAAVVTESGGPLSHGAVIAREMKIPAVTSARNALSLLKNEQSVIVDGTTGKIYLKLK
jgi:phosphoenolpyruvate synthase/pyruvate phosphate dikinase